VQRGITSILIIIFVVIVVGLVGTWFWFSGGLTKITYNVAEGSCVVATYQRKFESDKYYEGTLIDAHVHMPMGSQIVKTVATAVGFPNMPVMGNEISMADINCLMENEGITNILGFYMMPKFGSGTSLSVFQKVDEVYPGKITPFFMPPPVKALDLSISETRKIIAGSDGFFKGIGELPLYQQSYDGVMPTDEYFRGLYKIAQDEGLIIMIHVSDRQQNAAEKVVQEFTDVKFLFHGEDYVEWIDYMMTSYENFYYSLDANISGIYSIANGRGEHEITTQEYADYMGNNFEKVLGYAQNKWSATIEKHPDRFMWGTDRWFTWTYEPELGKVLEEFGRVFIGGLDPSVQENFAHKNAEIILLK